MKFISCSKPNHPSFGVNSRVNLDLCLSYTAGIYAKDAHQQPAPAILFTTSCGGVGNTWVFETEDNRDEELARLDAILTELTSAEVWRTIAA